MRCLGSTACTHLLCINVSPGQFFSHPLFPSCMCVTLCLRSISPVFHAHLLIRISTGREDPHSLDRSGGNRLQEVHLCQRRLELRHRHVGSYVVWRAAVLGHEQSRCKITSLYIRNHLLLPFILFLTTHPPTAPTFSCPCFCE